MMNVFALAKENPAATDDEIDSFLSGNLCRCSGYVSQRRAIKKYLAMKLQEVRA
jgi:carbon-monoxide dehydrogenase small subunit